ncbi:hypothetical protein Q9L58_009678 [Maublancomyces gigas]|uniref:Uncharacterized protein n=1 Tax=Discina gigas TaxID=1032678 RepID=A0ABR3G670_9PEZI
MVPALDTATAALPVTGNQTTGTSSTRNSATAVGQASASPTGTLATGHPTHLPGAILMSPRNSPSPWEAALGKLSPEEQQGLSVTGLDKLCILDQVLEETYKTRDNCLEKQWKYNLKGKTIILRDVADKLIGWVEKFKSIGDVVASFNPTHAALPWAGVRFLLQIAVDDSQKMAELLEALEDIANLIGRCAIYETLYLGNQNTSAVRCEEVIIELYACILQYLFQAKKYYSKNTAARVVTSAFDTTLVSLLDDVNKKKVTVFEVTALAETEYKRSADAILGDRISHITGTLNKHIQDSKKLQSLLEQFTTPIFQMQSDIQVIRDGLEDAERSKILQWISSIEYAKHHLNATEDCIDGTGEWLFRRNDFLAWENSRDSTILWLHGIPGAGKTKLTSRVIDKLIQQQENPSNNNSHALAYFYCKRDETGSSNPDLVMSAIVKQLSCLKVGLALQKQVVSMYNTRKSSGFSSNSLAFQESLDLIISLADTYTQTFIVIDALDECDPHNRRKFLDSLQTIIKTSRLVKIFASSRDDNDIVRRLDGVPNLWIEARDNEGDIRRFVQKEVTRCIESKDLLNGKVTEELEGKIIMSLTNRAQGMFLWVDLQIKELCMMDLVLDVELRLGALPDTLENTYTKIYQRILSQRGGSPQLAKRALMWVMCSCRPFSPDELVTVISQGSPSEGVLDTQSLFKICHNLLTLDRQLNIVRFAHLSVREFLEKTQFTIVESNTMASESCLSYLMKPGTLMEVRALVYSTHAYALPVAAYPAFYWPIHVQACQHQGSSLQLSGLLIDFLRMSYSEWYETAKIINHRWRHEKSLEILWELDFDPPALLQLASGFGFGEIIKSLWDSESWNIDAKNSSGTAVLYIASRLGFSWITRTLLERGADVNAQAGHFWNALQAAASKAGNEKTVELLLEKGADVNAQGGHFGNALQAAAYQPGNEKTVELLLGNGADVNIHGGQFGNALQAAVYEAGNEKTVKLLLEKGADVNSTQDGYFGNALQSAASEVGNEKTVELLLEKGADVNAAQGGHFGNALQEAVYQLGNEKTVELLLINGANVNAQGGYFGNALQAAAYQGNEKAVELLLDNGADVNAQGGRFGNALQAAAYQPRNEKTVELLLGKGADVNAQCGHFGNALQAAASKVGNEKTLELLLEKRADVNAEGGRFGNALQAAVSEAGNEKTVKLLLDKGADVNSAQDGYFGNALQAAAYQPGNERTVELLLENGADVNAQGGQFGNALQAAASQYRNEKTVELLLVNGADVTAQGGHFWNALQAAAYQPGNEKTVELLLENGADVNAQGGRFRNALQAATSKFGNEKTVELLRKNGANVWNRATAAEVTTS